MSAKRKPTEIWPPQTRIKKRCYRCKTIKPLEEFHRESRRPDGRNVECKPCKRLRSGVYSYVAGPERRERRRLTAQRCDKANRAKKNEYRRQRQAQYPERYRAIRLVSKAVKQGLLVRPDKCQRCGTEGRVEGSHDDYSKPYMVEWLCPLCHRRKDYPNLVINDPAAKPFLAAAFPEEVPSDD